MRKVGIATIYLFTVVSLISATQTAPFRWLRAHGAHPQMSRRYRASEPAPLLGLELHAQGDPPNERTLTAWPLVLDMWGKPEAWLLSDLPPYA